MQKKSLKRIALKLLCLMALTGCGQGTQITSSPSKEKRMGTPAVTATVRVETVVARSSESGSNPAKPPPERDDRARNAAARTTVAFLETALDAFEVDMSRYPTTAEGLGALTNRLDDKYWLGPYMLRPAGNDPWGNAYIYKQPGTHNRGGFDVYSKGPNGIEDDGDDIGNWFSDPVVPVGPKAVSRKELGFEITFSDTWAVKTSIQKRDTNGGEITATAPVAQGAKDYAYVTAESEDLPEGVTLKAFVQEMLSGFSKANLNYELIENVELKLSGADAVKAVYLSDRGDTKIRSKCAAYFLIVGRRGYMLRLFAYKDDYDKYANEFDAIVKSFKLLDAK